MTEISKKAYSYALAIYAVLAIYFWYIAYALGLFLSKHYFSQSASSVFSIQNSKFTTLNGTFSAVLTFILILALFLNKRLRTFFIDVGDEISRISYPTFKEAQRKTLLVIGLIIVSSICLFMFDLAFVKLVRLILGTAA
jgi:preprotein translocase subunit SecE